MREQLEAQRGAVEEAIEARAKAAQAQAALSEVLAARRGAREALGEMAAQNARLVVGYCAKKAELKRLQEGLAAERARWEVTYCSPTAYLCWGQCQPHRIVCDPSHSWCRLDCGSNLLSMGLSNTLVVNVLIGALCCEAMSWPTACLLSTLIYSSFA